MRRCAAAILFPIALVLLAIANGIIEFAPPRPPPPTPADEGGTAEPQALPGEPREVPLAATPRAAVTEAGPAGAPSPPTAALPRNHGEPDCDFPFVEDRPQSESGRYDLFSGTSENARWSGRGLRWAERSLGFFVRRQRVDGSWEENPRTTALVLLCFLGEGETHRGGSYTRTVREGLAWLIRRQSTAGWFTPERDPAGQAIATLLLCDTWRATQLEIVKDAARKGLACLETLGPGADPATWWMLLAQRSAKAGGIVDCIPGFEKAMDLVIPNDRSRTPGASWEAAPGARILARILAGEDPRRSEEIQALADECNRKLPVWEGPLVDPGAWFFKSMGLFQVGGDHWKKWSSACLPALRTSRTDLDDGSGFWESDSPRARILGRIETTALLTLCQQMYYCGARMPGLPR